MRRYGEAERARAETLQEHMKAPHLEAYMAATEGAIAEFTLAEMTHID